MIDTTLSSFSPSRSQDSPTALKERMVHRRLETVSCTHRLYWLVTQTLYNPERHFENVAIEPENPATCLVRRQQFSVDCEEHHATFLGEVEDRERSLLIYRVVLQML